MGTRVVNGNSFTEDGWPLVDQAGCTWIHVPGTNVTIQVQSGPPAAILGAWEADWNAYLEPLEDATTGCWTEGNSVLGTPGRNNGSNHLGGSATDSCWERHPFQKRGSFNPAQLAVMQEMLDFYEGMVFWAGVDWSEGGWGSPIDEMHSQMGYGTYDQKANRPTPKVFDFIARKIRADGYSTFRRANNPAPPPPPIPAPAQLSRAEGYALRILNEGRKRGVTPKGIQIAFATGIVESNITVYANQKLPKSLALPHDAVGNDGYSVGIFQQQVRDTGNGWWWGDEQTCMGVESSAGLFYDRLVKLPYNGTSKTPGGFAQQIQGSAYPLRYDENWDEAVALYNKLAGIPTQGDDDLSAEAEQQIAQILAKVNALEAEWSAAKQGPSRSFLATDKKLIDSPLGFLYNLDGNVWTQQLTWGYLLGVSDAEQVVEGVASTGVIPDNWASSQPWLVEFGVEWCRGLVALRSAMQRAFKNAGAAPTAAAPQVVYRDAPAPAPVSAGDTGDHIAATYRANEALLAADVDKGAADQLVSMLKTKTEGTPS